MELNSEHCGVDVIQEKFDLRLSQFIYKRVLCSINGRKSICVEGSLRNKEGIAIIFFEKNPIPYKTVSDLCTGNSTVENQVEVGAIGNCSNYLCFPGENLNGLKMMLIFPATMKHVQKYESCPCHIIEETPELYRDVVLPYITRESFNLQWVYNIFDHLAEQESIIYEDQDPKNGFLLATDFKWDKKHIDNLHVLAIARPRNITSLRDLTADHLTLLRNINSKGTEVIKNLFGLSKNQLRIYFHYQPSYYHLHVHFTNIEYQAPGINATKAHSLDSVIRNMELITDYYQRATLTYVLKETDGLFKCIKESEHSEEKYLNPQQ